jgi:hypothetical protein
VSYQLSELYGAVRQFRRTHTGQDCERAWAKSSRYGQVATGDIDVDVARSRTDHKKLRLDASGAVAGAEN